jgi:hypothetical protein
MTGMQPLIILIRLECMYRDMLAKAGPIYRDNRKSRRAYLIALSEFIRFDLPYMDPPLKPR